MSAGTLALAPQRQRFDRTIWNQLSSLDVRILDELAYLSRLQAQKSTTGARYCVPGRRWLAERLGCSVETISEHTSRLADLGLIRKLQRRPLDGKFQTNLYRLIHPMAWMAARVARAVTRVANRMPRMAHIASVQRTERVSQQPKESLRDIIQRGLRKFAPT